MKIEFNKDTMPDDLYNVLLQHFVTEARIQGYPVDRFTRFENWVVECEVDPLDK